MTNYIKQNILILSVIAMLAVLLCGCGNKEKVKKLEVRGGDLLRYSLCLEEEYSQTVSCPIVLNRKAKDISFNGYVAENNDLLSLTAVETDMDNCVKYNGYYVYFAIVNVACEKYDEVIDVDIDKLLFDIDDELVEYATPHFNVKNTTYYCEKEDCIIEENSLMISDGFTGIYGYIPDENNKINLTLTIDKDVKIESYMLADFLKVENLEIYGNNYDSNRIDLDLKKNKDIPLLYTLGFGDDISEDCIIRSSQIIIYEKNNQKYLWVYEPGIYIWKDYAEYGNIERYIDAL